MEARPFSAPRTARGATGSEAPPMADRDLHLPKSCSMPMHPKIQLLLQRYDRLLSKNCEGVWLDKGELQDIEIFFERNKPAERIIFTGRL